MRVNLAAFLTALSLLAIFVSPSTFAANGVADPKWKLEPLCLQAELKDGLRVCEGGGRTIIEYYENDRILGQLFCTLKENPSKNQTLYIPRYQVHKDSRGKGISRRLFGKLLELAGPHVERVEAELAYSNIEALHEELTALRSESHKYTLREFNKIAVKGTPFVRAWSKLGYSEVIDFKSDPAEKKSILLGKTNDPAICDERLSGKAK